MCLGKISSAVLSALNRAIPIAGATQIRIPRKFW